MEQKFSVKPATARMRCVWEKKWERLFSAEAAMLFSKMFMGKASLYRSSLNGERDFTN
jgi:hypothetical protein